MNDDALLILSLLAGVRREKGLALLCKTASGLSENEEFEAQAARNEAVFSQINANGAIPQTLFLPRSMPEALVLRGNASFRDSLDFEGLSEWYLLNLESPAHRLALALLAQWPGLAASQSSAGGYLLEALGALGQLRDAGLGVYGRGGITNTDVARIKLLARAYFTFERLFLNLAGEALRAKTRSLKPARPEDQEIFDDILRKLKEGSAKSVFANTPAPVWFQTIDALLEEANASLAEWLTTLARKKEEDDRFRTMANALDSSVENERAALATLPLFRGLTEQAFRSVLEDAKIVKFERDKTVLTQGEPANRIFIVLEGLVKSFKSAEDGNEVVVQILGKKECLLDAGIVLGVSTVHLKTVTRTRLLALSSSVVREQSVKTPMITANLLALTTARLHKFLSHFEQLTLRQAHQRVGWFLVNLYLETGIEGTPLKLPFDKSLIAAYLNIKPETFSRVLGAFRKEGFIIEKDKVALPHPQALCAFCDPITALKCCRAEALACAPIKAAKRT